MSTTLLQKIYLDDVLVKFSLWGRYHAVTILCLTLALLQETMCFSNFIFVAEKVEYRCAENTSTYIDGNETSNRYSQNATTSWCNGPAPCAQWIYENPNSFVAEFQLACQEWKRTLVGTMHFCGLFGVIFIGPLSDRFGRRTLVIITGVAGAVCGLAKSFVTFYWIYIAFEFIEAAIGDSYSPLYMLIVEMVATDSRVNYTTICNIGLTIAGMLLSLTMWFFPYWRTSLRVIYAPGLLFILLIYLVDESPRWLLTKGKLNAVVKNIEKAAGLNKIEMTENLTMLSHETDSDTNFMKAITDTFKSKPLMKRLFICLFWWNTCTFVDNGLMINSVLLEGNKYVNYALMSAVRLPAALIAAYAMNKFNRKGPLILSFVACAVLCTSQPFIPNDRNWLVIIMYMASKLTSGMNFKITYIFTSELFPTYTRNSMHALCSCLGRVGSIVATQMPLLVVYWSGLPIVIFGATSLIAALVTLLVPDTAKTALPDTVRQAEALGVLETRILIKKGRAAIQRSRNNSATFELSHCT